jgi:hypothetical protein
MAENGWISGLAPQGERSGGRNYGRQRLVIILEQRIQADHTWAKVWPHGNFLR